MTATEVTKFVDGLLSSKHDLPSFKNHIRDFLVQSKEFSAQVTSSVSLSITIVLIMICLRQTERDKRVLSGMPYHHR